MPSTSSGSSSLRFDVPAAAWLIWLSLTCLVGNASGQLPTLSVRALTQSFFAPGGTYEVAIAEGDNTQRVDRLLLTPEGLKAELLSSPAKPFDEHESKRYGHFRIEIPKDAVEGFFELRAQGRFGVSNPRRILIADGIRMVTEVSHDPKTAVPLAMSETVCRSVSPQQRDFYRISVKEGQRYRLRVIGRSVDSRILPAVTIGKQDGNTLLSTMGSDLEDLEISFEAEETSDLLIEIHDALFRGGASFQYGLTVRSENGEAPGAVPMPSRWLADSKWATARPASAAVIGSEGLRDLPSGVIPDDQPAESTEISIPATVDAHFPRNGRPAHYLVDLKKGQVVFAEVVSNGMGEATDPRLVIERAEKSAEGVNWKRVAEMDDAPSLTDSVLRLSSNDPALRFQSPEDGRYRILVSNQGRDAYDGHGKRYRLRVHSPAADFQLVAYRLYPHKDANASRPLGNSVLRGGAAVIRVFAKRFEMNGPIEVVLEGLPDGLECRNAIIAPNQSQTDLVVVASEDTPSLTARIRVSGTAMAGESRVRREAQFATVVWESDGARPFARTRLAADLALSTSGLDLSPLSISQRDGSNALKVKKGEKTIFPIKLTRREGSKDNVVIRARQTPPGVKIPDLTIAGDQSEGDWNIEVTQQVQSGTYTLWGEGETKVKFAVDPQALTGANAYLDRLKSLRADPSRSADHAALDKAIEGANKEVESLKKQTAARDFTVYLPTPLITLIIE